MGRKNSNVRRSHARGRAEKGEFRHKPAPSPYTPPAIEKTIIPDGRCVRPGTGGRPGMARYDTAAKAQKALEQAQARRRGQATGHVEKRFYDCPFCVGFHLTSRETWESKPVTRTQP